MQKPGLRFVLTSAVPSLWFDPTIDITAEVIKEMRARGFEAAPAEPDPKADAAPEGES